MSKAIILGKEAIEKLKEAVKAGSDTVSPDPVEADEYTIGSEKGPVPVGGSYFHIKEELLKEGLSQNLYHFTGIGAGYKICSNDVIYLQSAFAKESDNYDKKRKFYLSCTRQYNSKFGFSRKFSSGGVRICLDGDLLANNFAGKQVNYWGGGVFTDKYAYYKDMPKDEKELWDRNSWEIRRLKEKNPNITDDEIRQYLLNNYNKTAQEHIDNESEDRLFSYEPAIYDAHKYIKSIDVLIPDLFEDEKKQSVAASFLFRTRLGRQGNLVRVFDSAEQFAHPKGKPVNDKIKYTFDTISPEGYEKGCLTQLCDVLGFITYGDPNYDKEVFGQNAAKLLDKYGLGNYKKNIGYFRDNLSKRYSFNSVCDSLIATRRDLSDEPSEDKSRILKMLTDYCLSLGANSLPEAINKKKGTIQKRFGYGNVYDRIDTSAKIPYYVVDNYVISLHPDTDRFADAIMWDDDKCRSYAEVLAGEIDYNSDGVQYNTGGSKNFQSLFHYIDKLFRKGSVAQVKETLEKLGFTEEFLQGYGMNIDVKELDYWGAVSMNTINSKKALESGMDYMKAARMKDKEIEDYVFSKIGALKEEKSPNVKTLIKESYDSLSSINMSEVGEVEYSCDFDEDDYQEWLSEEGETDSPDKLIEYFHYNVNYELELYDNDTLHHLCYSDGSYDDLCDVFGRNIADMIVKDSMEGKSGKFEARDMYDDSAVDVNNEQSVAEYAVKIFQHGQYYKDCRGFILYNGVMIYTPAEHNMVTIIPGVGTKFEFIRLGNIRVLDHSIDIGREPTKEQYAVLSQIASAYAGDVLYLDIFTQEGGEIGAKYENVRPSYVIGEIKRYYAEGIKPQGSTMYESKLNEDVIPTQYDDDINRLSAELSALGDEMAKKYNNKFWFSRAMFPDLKVDDADREKRNALYNEYKKLKELRDVEYRKEEERQRYQKAKENARRYQEEQRIIDLAIERYGTTYNLLNAGYILPDGRLLDFQRNGDAEDHRGIEGVYKSNGIEIWDDQYRYNYVVDFMNHGAIRCDANAGVLDMTREPSKEQYDVIKMLVRKAGDVDIDFTNNKGDTDNSVSYSNASPQRVVADIQRYYREGIIPQGNVQYEEKEGKKIIKENIESEVEASEVDLSSFEKQDTLEPSIWKEGKLDSRIRLKLLDIADDFWDFIGIDWAEPVGIHLTGSICGFNYSKFSDIDLHLVADFAEIDERKNFVRQYMDEKKAAWNSAHPGLKIMGYEVELYVEDVDDDTKSEGVYDLEENDWIRKPGEGMELSSEDSIKQKSADLMTIIDGMGEMLQKTDDSHVFDEIYDDAILMFRKLKQMRTSALDSDGEAGIGNIVYKSLRRGGYLDKLGDILNAAYDKKNSINESTLIKEDWSNGEKDPVQYLYNYLRWAKNATDREKAEDLAYHNSWNCKRYFQDNCDGDDDSEEYGINLDELEYGDEEAVNHFLDWVENNVGLKDFLQDANYNWYHGDLPSWMHMELVKYMPNSWLIHFTNHASKLAYEGFKYGTDDMQALGYTKRRAEGDSGYNFAFDINDKLNQNYGDEAVIFRTSGVKVEHFGDLERQVIFWGPSVKWMVPIYFDGDYGDWVIKDGKTGRVLCTGSPDRLAYWVEDNYPQYRNTVTWDVNEMLDNAKMLIENNALVEEPTTGFDAWYGNSVLRDEEGNPIKMYHGTSSKFDKFDKSFIGSSGSGSFEGYGFNFTPFETRAGHYSSPEGEVWEAYLKAEHPLANDKKTITPRKLAEIIRQLDEGLPVTDRMVVAYEPPRYGEKWDERYYNRALPIVAKQLYDYTESDADLYAEICAGGASDKYRVIDAFEKLGYDSCILKDNDGRLNTVVVFEPEQIMRCSTFDNNGLNESIEEEIVADGNSEHNPYSKRWKAEREALKNFLVNFGKIMTSKENGKQYKVYFDQTLSDLIGYNYCICVQWDPIELIPGSTPYIRALDKFTNRIFQPDFDDRGFDNVRGTADDVVMP